ncbi:MAG: YggS family pyridoxal phosphate-dependent enzyme [Cryomorphaceae bacterium]|jgi:pyridoxal phosphate enzyme (YggS family)|nr:YggS family pyridoxal phosphate-dependent enzyme [Cryomorphaceae bacterium]
MIAERLSELLQKLPASVTLVAVSKTKPVSAILEAYDLGQRDFGENKVQELVDKYEQLPKDIRWHLIGHLQSNKVKYIAPFVHLIHSVDSLKLLKEINKQGAKNHRTIDCLLQFHIAQEETKFGLNLAEAIELLESEDFKSFNHVRICGVMGMASFTEDFELIRTEFRTLKGNYSTLKERFFNDSNYFKELSFGMSSDYSLAIEEGSTMIRVGSTLFGER